MAFIAVKDVPESVWRRFKSESARHNLRMAEFLEKLLIEHEARDQESAHAWKRVLHGKSLLTRTEANALKESTKAFREGFTFRT